MSFQEDFDRDSRTFPQKGPGGKFREFGGARGRSAYRGPRPPRFPDAWRRDSSGTYRDGKDKWGWDKDRSPAPGSIKERYDRYTRDGDRDDRNRSRYSFPQDRETQKKSLLQSMQMDRRPTLLGSRYHSARESDPRFDDDRDSSSSPIDVVGDSPPGKGGFDDLDNVDDISGDEDDFPSSKRPRLDDLYSERSSRLLMSTKAESLSPLSPGEVTPPRYDRPQMLNRSRLLPHSNSTETLQQIEELEPLEDKFDAISDDEVDTKEESAANQTEESKDDDPRRRLPAREEIFSALEKIDSEINKMVKRLERVHAKKRATEGDAQEEEDLSQMDDVTRISKENIIKATSINKTVTKLLGDYAPKDPYKPLFRRPSEVPSFLENQKRHDSVRSLLVQKFAAKNIRLLEKKRELVSVYKAHAEKWKIKAKRFERKREKVVKPPPMPEPRAPPPAPLPDKKPGRSRNRHGDAVRSEEEMQQILMELLEEERENPEIGYIRTLAVIPPMILDEDEKNRKFSNLNGLVENAEELEREVKFGSPWTEQEKIIFIESYLAYPKNFRKIRTFLQNKTTEDVIQFYYLNKRTLALKQRLKQGNKRRRAQQKGASGKSQMLISQAQPRKREKEETTLPPSAPTTQAPTPVPAQPSVTEDSAGDQPTRWAESEKEKVIEALTMHGLDFNLIAAHVGSKTSLQCRNFFNNNKKKYNLEKIVEDRPKKPSLDQGEQPPQAPPQKMDSDGEDGKDTSRPDSPVGDEKASKGDSAKKKPARQQPKERRPIAVWTNAEKNQIVKLLSQYGKNWNKLSQEVKTKTPGQIKNFFQNYKQKLNLGKVLPRTGRRKSAGGDRDDDDDDDDDDKERDLEAGEQVDMKEFEPTKVKKEPKSASKSATQSQAQSQVTTPLPSPKPLPHNPASQTPPPQMGLPQPPLLPPLQDLLAGSLPPPSLSMATTFVSPLFSLAEISSTQIPLPGIRLEDLPPQLPPLILPEKSTATPMDVTTTDPKEQG